MATQCIDISDNRKITSSSPIAMGAFFIIYVVLSALMKPGIWYFVLVLGSFVLTQIFFQYTPRFIKLSIEFLFTNSYLTPSFEDFSYVYNEERLANLKKVISKEAKIYADGEEDSPEY